jgi:hypothetical protein
MDFNSREEKQNILDETSFHKIDFFQNNTNFESIYIFLLTNIFFVYKFFLYFKSK